MSDDRYDAEFERGLQLLEAGKFEEAIRSFDRRLEFDASAFEALGNRGVAKAKSGDLLGAHADFDAVVGLQPESSGWDRMELQSPIASRS